MPRAQARPDAVDSGEYAWTTTLQEDHRKAIFCVCWNHVDPAHSHLFASVGAARATIYAAHAGGSLEPLQVYVDEDHDENYFCCTWGRDDDGAALLLCAGQKGVIRIINASAQRLHKSLPGHGNAINDLRVHPTCPALLASVSRDLSVRLWNLHTGVLALVLAGEGGHRNEVLSCDWARGQRCTLASCGIDNTIKVWTATDTEWETVQLALSSWAPDGTPLGVFPTRYCQLPAFSSYLVHNNYVDCVRFFGDGALLSKAVDSGVTAWVREAGPYGACGHARVLWEVELEHTQLWFIRFALSADGATLAAGDAKGCVRVWDTAVVPARLMAQLRCRQPPPIAKPGSKAAAAAFARAALHEFPVRQAAPNADGSIVLACCDDGSITRWDRIRPDGAEHDGGAGGSGHR